MKKKGKLILKNFMDDEDLHLEIFASNGDFDALQDFYVSKQSFIDFGKKLHAYTGNKDEVVFECGENDPKWYCFIRVRVYPFKSSGHSAIEIVIDNHRDKPSLGRTEFSIQCLPSDINRLGRLIIDWIPECNPQVEWFLEE